MTNDNVSYELGPGMVNMLNPGEKVEIADAKRPSTNFDAFVTALSKYIGAALEIGRTTDKELHVKLFRFTRRPSGSLEGFSNEKGVACR